MTILVAVQMCSTPNVDENLAFIDQQLALIKQAHYDTDVIAVLPECCLLFGGAEDQQLALAKQNDSNQFLTKALSALAKKYALTLVAGSIPLLSKQDNTEKSKFTNSCCVFNPKGEQQAQYNKIHLFDVDVNTDINGKEKTDSNAYHESAYTQAGDSCTVTTVAGLNSDSDSGPDSNKSITVNLNLGLTICYDLRFPELFRQLRTQDATVITVPSAFTHVTGKAHWQALLQARAIENQVYIVAAGQQGIHSNGRETWGHSMIINPWGEIISCIETGTGFVSAPYNEQELMQLRAAMPVAAHNQFTSHLTKKSK